MTFQQRIGKPVVDTVVPVTASAEVGPAKRRDNEGYGEFTNRVEVRAVNEKRGMKKRKRYRKDPKLHGGPRRQTCLTWTPSKIFLMDAMAERREISRSELVRTATEQFAAATPPTKQEVIGYASYCLSLPEAVKARMLADAEARGLTLSEFVRRSVEYFAAHETFTNEPER